MLLWLYKMVIRPMVTYGSLVWWIKLHRVVDCREISKIQRLICVAVTGAVRSALTIALEALLDLPPLWTEIKKDSVSNALRLLDQFKFLEGDLTGHLSILKEFPNLLEMTVTTDRMPSAFNFDLPFEIRIPERLEWDENIVLDEEIKIFYTDGSKTENGVGVGVSGPSFEHSDPLGPLDPLGPRVQFFSISS